MAKKRQKDNQNRVNSLIFNGLTQGLSWNQIQEIQDEMNRQGKQKTPTQEDILTDWIIMKDLMLQQQGNSYRKGGHLFVGGGYNDWLNDYKANNNPVGANGNYTWGQLSNAKLNDSFSNGNGLGSSLGIASTALSLLGDAYNSATSVDSTEQQAAIDQVRNQYIGFGDNAYMMGQADNVQRAETSYDRTDVGGHTGLQAAGNIGKGILQGATTGLTVGGPWGAVIGAAAGLLTSGTGELVNYFNSEDEANKLEQLAQIGNSQIDTKLGYSTDMSQQLQALNQRQYLTKNGGHLAQDGRFLNRLKTGIANAMQEDLNYSDAPSINQQRRVDALRGITPFEFGGGDFSGSGASGFFYSPENFSTPYYIMNTPLPGRSFSDAFAEAVRNNKDFFYFNGKKYSTEKASSNEEYLNNRTKAEYEEPLNLRTVYDSDWNIYPDSTRVEPYVGQIPIIEKQKKSKGGKLKSYRFAEGGLLNTFDVGLTEVNAGGSHEENPNEGVVVSYAQDGLPNKVEEGETIHNDYVFSKRLKANKKVLNSNLLDEKYEGKPFAEISKELSKDRKERPNDPISKRTQEENLQRLEGAQEEFKIDRETKQVKRFLGSLNDLQLDALQQQMMEEYQAYAEQQAQQEEQEAQQYQEEQAAQEGMFGRGGHLKQGYGSSLISSTQPVYNAEGKLVGWREPNDAPSEKTLNLSGYNPNYKEAQIYADDRNWWERNVASPWKTWWNNLPSPEFSWAVRNLTPVGIADAIITGDTDQVLANATPVRGKMVSRNFGKTEDVLQNDRIVDEAWKKAQGVKKGNKPVQKTKVTTEKVNTSKETVTNSPVTEDTSVTEDTGKHWKKRVKNTLLSALGLGAATGATALGVNAHRKSEERKAYFSSEIPISNDTVIGNIRINADGSLELIPDENEYSKGGHLLQDGNKTNPSTSRTTAFDVWNQLRGQRARVSTSAAPLSSQEVFGNSFGKGYGILSTLSNSNATNQPSTVYTIPSYSPVIDDNNNLLLQAMLSYENVGRNTNDNNSIPSSSNNKPSSASPKLNNKNPDASTSRTPIAAIPSLPAVQPQYIGLDYMPDATPVDITIPKNYILGTDSIPNINQKGRKTKDPDKNNYLSYLRYAPILGSLGQVMSDTLGLTNQPDYSNIDMYRRAVDSIGGVNFVPIGGYQTYLPIDTEYTTNQMMANAAARRRGNPSADYSTQMLNDYALLSAIGENKIKANAQDEANKKQVAEFNRGINITNAQNSLTAQERNAALRKARADEYRYISQMMDNERNTSEAARAANYNTLMTNIGNLGREEFNMRMVNENPSLYYSIERDGGITFKRAFYALPRETQEAIMADVESRGYTIK